jgi:rubredoxin
MSLPNATPAMIAMARYFSRPLCPACGCEQLVPEQSSFLEDGFRIRHAWQCEDCGHAFDTHIGLDHLG